MSIASILSHRERSRSPLVTDFAVNRAVQAGRWVFAKAQGDHRVALTCRAVPIPVARRYAWAFNPVCCLTSLEVSPITPFRANP